MSSENNKETHEPTININVEVVGELDPKEIKERLQEVIENELIAANIQDSIKFEDTDDSFIQELKIPDNAYTDDGELKENYRKAYKTLIEAEREKHKALIEDDGDIPEPVEIGDGASFDIKYIVNSLISNTGMVEEVKLYFKKCHTPIILKTLGQYKTMLSENLTWSIKSFNDEYIILKLSRE